MPDVIPTIPIEPQQGIQATLDTLYLYNPDAVNVVIERINVLIQAIASIPEAGVRPYEDLRIPVVKYSCMSYNGCVYAATEDIETALPETPDMSKWTLVATTTTIADIVTRVSAEATLRANADTELSGRITDEVNARIAGDNALGLDVQGEAGLRVAADNALQAQIDTIVASSDVADIVGTHAELLQYDTSTLHDGSIIKVLQDETQNDATTYYRWVIVSDVGSWSLIGSEGPYYTVAETDALLADKSTVYIKDWSAEEL